MTMLTKFNAHNDVSHLHDELNRWFGSGFPFARLGESLGWVPPVDIFENAEGLTLKLDLPEVDPKDLKINLEDGVLTLSGERKLEHEGERDGYHRIERSYGTFTRSFSLPATLDFEKVSAESKQGTLRVFIPRKPEAKPKTIEVKVAA